MVQKLSLKSKEEKGVVAHNTTVLYHGTDRVVDVPDLRRVGHSKDFSWGFYCTRKYKQAEGRAMLSRFKNHIVNVYEFTTMGGLKYKYFLDNPDWLHFIVMCCIADYQDELAHAYDIVEGPMADDKVWRVSDDYIDGYLSFDRLFCKAEFGHETNQISFHTARALTCLNFIDAYDVVSRKSVITGHSVETL